MIYIYIYVYIYTYICTFARMYVCIHAYMIHTHKHIRVYGQVAQSDDVGECITCMALIKDGDKLLTGVCACELSVLVHTRVCAST